MEPARRTITKKKVYDFPKRPTMSSNFRCKTVKVVSNHYSISLSKKQGFIYLYSVALINSKEEDVAEDDRETYQGVIRNLRKELAEVYGKTFLFSGKNIWSFFSVKDTKTYETKLGGEMYYMKIIKVKDLNLKPGSFDNNEQAGAVRQFMNILIKRFFKVSKFIEWGRNAKFYDPDKHSRINLLESDKIPIEVWTGFKTSCEIYKNGQLKILIDFSSRILRTDSVLGFMKSCKNRAEIEDGVIGRSVVTNYGNFRMWRVEHINWEKSPLTTFKDDKGRDVTLMDYYKTRYNIQIKDKNQPLLVSEDIRQRKTIYLIPELVRMTGLTEEMRANFKVMKAVGNHTRLEPTQRMEKVYNIADPISKDLFKEYGIEMESKNYIEAIQLQMPALTLGKKDFVPQKGNYQLRDPIFRPAVFAKGKWLVVLPVELKESKAGNYGTYFVEMLQKASGAFGIRVEQPIYIYVNSRTATKAQEEIRANVKVDTMIVVCIYPKIAKKGWYKALKDVCTHELGIPSQGVVADTLDNEKGIMSVASKILIQMNVKVGLEPWITAKPAGLSEKTMIIGADVFHKADKNYKSCVGFCASMDPNFAKYFSKVYFQKPGEELMKGIGGLVEAAIKAYYDYNKYVPEVILFYRDGVGESQRGLVLDYEVDAILKAFKNINKDYKPKFAEIIVTKRIDDRFFIEKSANNKITYDNPETGTLIHDGIVSNNFDFFLIPQKVTQGSCTPTHYFCVYNDTDLPQDVFYQLTYNQCFNYYNWNGSVRVPAACQYAHKLAYLVGQTLRDAHDPKLDNKLFFL